MSLSSLLGTDLPLIQAPMAGVQDSALAIAVSRAGALGSLPAAMLTPQVLAKELAAIAAASERPYNVNFFCHTAPQAGDSAEAAWREALAPYYREFDIDPAGIAAGPGRRPFDADAVQLLERFRPRVVSFHFGLPEPALMQRLRSWGAILLSSATTVAEARWLQAQGVDAVIAQGLEAGGHRGHFLDQDLSLQMGTYALLPQIARAVRVPVIAAGGIADAAGVAAAMRLGAAGVQVGTAYLLCPESRTSAVHRAALASEAAAHTALTNLYTGRPARGIVTRLMRELGPINTVAPPFPLATSAVAPLRAAAEAQGLGDFSPLWAGQNVSGCREVGAEALTRELALGFSRE
ncbi:NAD(P)H-dependent flavin oxidoreductase [Lysobacter silvisoli]|uniref:NAD(P)H-dependent flavin oxidoreductase n=1 Tax=Lysobacter silvisoli TaxID=2293254 RepID=UPI0018C895F8|nr:nitronate monooxygenase [Lysobacter silvisoli]